MPYIINYKTSLKDIKVLLEKCDELIINNKNKWQALARFNTNDFVSLIYEIKNCESQEKITICAILRRIIETILTLQILNNKKSVKKKFKYQGFCSYFDFFVKKKLNEKLKLYILRNVVIININMLFLSYD